MTQQISPSRRFRFYVGLVAVLMVAVSTLPAHAKRPHPKRHDQYKQQVEKLEDVWRTAQLSGDVTTIEQVLSDDYVGITMSGQVVSKTQQLDRMKNHIMALSKYEASDVKVKLIGSTAIVTSLAEIAGTYEGQPIHGTFRSTRVYTRLPGNGWKITNFEATRVAPSSRLEDRPKHTENQNQ